MGKISQILPNLVVKKKQFIDLPISLPGDSKCVNCKQEWGCRQGKYPSWNGKTNWYFGVRHSHTEGQRVAQWQYHSLLYINDWISQQGE